MNIIENTIIPDELKNLCFECDIERCKGSCCVEGDAGAPLTEDEISLLEDNIDKILPYMEQPGKDIVERNGVFDWDVDGQYVTPLVDDRECAFAIFFNDIAYCAIEKAWEENRISLQKPESCHLYPLRLTEQSNGMITIQYHEWPICSSALDNGASKQTRLHLFLEKALVKKFGIKWYEKLKHL